MKFFPDGSHQTEPIEVAEAIQEFYMALELIEWLKANNLLPKDFRVEEWAKEYAFGKLHCKGNVNLGDLLKEFTVTNNGMVIGYQKIRRTKRE